MKDKLRELAAKYRRHATSCGSPIYENCADDIQEILDAEGYGGAVLFAYGSEDGRVIPKATRDVALRDGGASKSATDIYTIPLYTHPARSGVVSDEDVRGAFAELIDSSKLVNTTFAVADCECDSCKIVNRLNAALTAVEKLK